MQNKQNGKSEVPTAEAVEQAFVEVVQRACARRGAKMELERILKLFPDLLSEVPQVQQIARAYHARQMRKVNHA